jgi:hypothetical protein
VEISVISFKAFGWLKTSHQGHNIPLHWLGVQAHNQNFLRREALVATAINPSHSPQTSSTTTTSGINSTFLQLLRFPSTLSQQPYFVSHSINKVSDVVIVLCLLMSLEES